MTTDAYEPSGPDGIAMHKLRRMVSKSAAFQARSGLTESELFDRCRYSVNDDLDAVPRPCYVIVVPPGGSSQGMIAGGGANFMLPHGRLLLFMEIEPHTDQLTQNDRALEAEDFFSRVIADIAALAAADDSGQETSHLDVRRIDQVDNWETPFQTEEATGVFYGAQFAIEWGDLQ